MSIKINNDTANGSSTLQPSNTATGDIVHTLPAFTTELAPRMQLGTAVASTSGTSIDFTGIPSWAKKITVMFSGISTNGLSPIIVQVGTGSGVENTGYSSSGSIITTGVTTTNYTAGFGTTGGTNDLATTVRSGQALITLMDGNSYTFSSMLSNTIAESRIGSGSKTLSGTLDRVRITTVNGTDTFDAGMINILVEG